MSYTKQTVISTTSKVVNDTTSLVETPHATTLQNNDVSEIYIETPNANFLTEVTTDIDEDNRIPLPKSLTIETDNQNANYTEPSATKETKYIYRFGLDSVSIVNKTPTPISGYISQPMDIGTVSYIQLLVDQDEADTSTEYSIIENNQETPILPVGQTHIVNEQLFIGLPLRFTPDTTQPIVIKKNGVETQMSISDLNKMTTTDVYTVSYTPIKQSINYYPKTSSIKVKVIQRISSDNELPPTIRSLVIQRYGGTKLWTI